MAQEIGPKPRLYEPFKPRGFGVKLPARPRRGRAGTPPTTIRIVAAGPRVQNESGKIIPLDR